MFWISDNTVLEVCKVEGVSSHVLFFSLLLLFLLLVVGDCFLQLMVLVVC